MAKTQELKSTIALILPLMAAFLAQKAMQFIDTIMMGWLGPSALAAGALGTGVFITTLVFCMGTLSAVGVFIARAKGANDQNDIAASLQNGIALAIALALPCMIIVRLVPHFITNEDSHVMHNVMLLLQGLSLGLPGYLLFLVFREFIAAFSLTRIVMLVTGMSIPFTFLLNYILIYGKYGMPQLGVSGIGYAGAVVMWGMFFGLLIYSLRHQQLKEFVKFNFVELKLKKIKEMLLIGVPSGAFFVLEAALFFAATIMMGHFGVNALAAFQIAIQCTVIVYTIPMSLAMATALQVSHAIGAGESFRIKTIAIQNFGLGLIFAIIVAIFFITAPDFFSHLFLTNDKAHAETIKLAASFLFIAAFFLCLDAVQAIANGMLRGLKDTFIPMVLSVSCYWLIGFPLLYYLTYHTAIGPKGIWYAISLSICSLGIVLMIRLLKSLCVIFRAQK